MCTCCSVELLAHVLMRDFIPFQTQQTYIGNVSPSLCESSLHRRLLVSLRLVSCDLILFTTKFSYSKRLPYITFQYGAPHVPLVDVEMCTWCLVELLACVLTRDFISFQTQQTYICNVNPSLCKSSLDQRLLVSLKLVLVILYCSPQNLVLARKLPYTT